MQALLHQLFSLFLSPWGLLILAVLDSSPIFYVPFATDVVLIILAARNPPRFWLYPVIATLGSVVGAPITYAMGKKLRESGLELLISRRRLETIKQKMSAKGPLALALPALMPPPFPFTGVLLTYGAMKIDKRKFLAALALMRLVRFNAESLLALRYGRRLIGWMKSDIVETVVWALTLLFLAGSLFSAYRFFKKSRKHARKRGTGPR